MSRRGGLGGVYRRGETYWVFYSYRGRQFRESSGSADEAKAYRLLKKRLRETGRPQFIGASEERLSFEDMMEMLRTDYSVNNRRSADKLSCRIAHLSEAFSLVRAIDITTDRITKYIADRQKVGDDGSRATNGTINRELAALKRAFTLAVRAGRLGSSPYIAMLEEDAPRQGFVEHCEFLSIRERLPAHLRDALTFLFLTGWRTSEMQSLEWRDVDLGGKTIRLRPEVSKNKDGREIPFSLFPELAEIFTRARENRRLDCRFVFHRDGKPLRDFRGSWAAACTKAGLGKTLVHDLRRSAVRNLVRAGVPERVAMEVTGHRTRSVFERYNIVSSADKQTAMQRLASYLKTQSTGPVIVPLSGGKSEV